MKYDYVPTQALKQNWDFVRFGLHKILRKSTATWIPEDVYAKIVQQQAHLWIVRKDDDNRVGFFILEPSGDTCHIWCTWIDEHGLVADVLAYIEEVAKSIGAKCVSFGTNRVGWTKVADKLGFIPQTWVKELR